MLENKIQTNYVYPVAVVYEGCPKAFDAGIWWPKTRFGRPAATQCPKGSVGEYFSYFLLLFSACLNNSKSVFKAL